LLAANERNLLSKGRGATFKQISKGDITELEIPEDPYENKTAIVARIQECLSRVEEMERLQAEAAEDGAQLLLTAVREILDPVIRDDRWTRFDELVDSTKLGLVRSKAQQGENLAFPYFKMHNIVPPGRVDLAELSRVDASEKEVEDFSLLPGDFLFNTRNSYELVGKTAIAPHHDEPLLFNNNIMRARFVEGISSRYVNYCFQHPTVQKELDMRKNKTTSVCAVYYKSLRTLKIPFPKKLAEQNSIVDRLEQIEKRVQEIGESSANASGDFPALRDAILRQAFDGDL
jgi:type I restriction enzyme S subunit